MWNSHTWLVQRLNHQAKTWRGGSAMKELLGRITKVTQVDSYENLTEENQKAWNEVIDLYREIVADAAEDSEMAMLERNFITW